MITQAYTFPTCLLMPKHTWTCFDLPLAVRISWRYASSRTWEQLQIRSISESLSVLHFTCSSFELNAWATRNWLQKNVQTGNAQPCSNDLILTHHAQIHWRMPGARPPPKGSKFFRFDIQNFQNKTVSGVHAPLRGPRRPLWEILDPPLTDLSIKEK